jgi:hypothetical protein
MTIFFGGGDEFMSRLVFLLSTSSLVEYPLFMCDGQVNGEALRLSQKQQTQQMDDPPRFCWRSYTREPVTTQRSQPIEKNEEAIREGASNHNQFLLRIILMKQTGRGCVEARRRYILNQGLLSDKTSLLLLEERRRD